MSEMTLGKMRQVARTPREFGALLIEHKMYGAYEWKRLQIVETGMELPIYTAIYHGVYIREYRIPRKRDRKNCQGSMRNQLCKF